MQDDYKQYRRRPEASTVLARRVTAAEGEDIVTVEGRKLHVDPGDYIALDVHLYPYPIEAHVFAKTWEQVVNPGDNIALLDQRD